VGPTFDFVEKKTGALPWTRRLAVAIAQTNRAREKERGTEHGSISPTFYEQLLRMQIPKV